MSDPATIRPGPEIDEEIEAAELSIALHSGDALGSAFPTSTYEDGVIAALRWVTGDSQLAPMTQEAAEL